MSHSPSDFSPPPNAVRFHPDHMSMSEYPPSPSTPNQKRQQDPMPLIMSFLSLETALLKIALRKSQQARSLLAIAFTRLQQGGQYGKANFDKLAKELLFYQDKAAQLTIQLKQQPAIVEHHHRGSSQPRTSHLKPQLQVNANAGLVRARALIRHTLLHWLDLSRILHQHSGNPVLLLSLSLAKWHTLVQPPLRPEHIDSTLVNPTFDAMWSQSLNKLPSLRAYPSVVYPYLDSPTQTDPHPRETVLRPGETSIPPEKIQGYPQQRLQASEQEI